MKGPKLQMLSWHTPNPSWYKLNVDGSSYGNLGECGGGGVIRNSEV